MSRTNEQKQKYLQKLNNGSDFLDKNAKKLTFSFKKEVLSTTENQETKIIKALDIDDIPEVLVRKERDPKKKKIYRKKEDTNKEDEFNMTACGDRKYIFHPSTFLRLLIFYLHKKGIEQGVKKILAVEKIKW